MGKGGHASAQCLEHLHLHGGIGHMVFAAQHLGHAHIDVIDDAWQHIEPRAIGAADHRIGHLPGLKMLGPANAIVPCDRRCVVKQKTPMRRLARRGAGGMVSLAQRQPRPIVNWRQASPQQNFTFEVQFLR